MLPREKLLKRGISVLSDIELLQILIGSGVKGRNFKQISKSVMQEIQQAIKKQSSIELKRLIRIEGVGEVVAMRVLCGIELGKRVYGIYDQEKVVVTDSQSAYTIFKDMQNLKRERVDMLCLNSRFEYISRESVAMGSLNCANLSPREVAYTALTNNSAFVILAHNHPSGDSSPSKEDVELTKNLNDGLNLIGIQLLDHIVIGLNSWKSITV